MSSAVLWSAVRICAAVSVGLNDFNTAAIAPAWGAAADVPKNESKKGTEVTTPSAAVMSGFCSTVPPVELTSPGVIGVPSGLKKMWRGPSELKNSTGSAVVNGVVRPNARDAATQNAFGAHAQILFGIPASSPVWVGYRFGILDSSSLILSDRVMEHTLGGYVGVPSLRMRVQLQATHVMEQAARALSNTRVQLAAEVAL